MGTLRAKALLKDNIAESGSPKFICALPSVTQACISTYEGNIMIQITKTVMRDWGSRPDVSIKLIALPCPRDQTGAETQ
jgi:hypothetical protein